jgi:hypothetical protein
MRPFFDGKGALRLQLAADWVVVEYDYAFQGTWSKLCQVFDLVFTVIYNGAMVPVNNSEARVSNTAANCTSRVT